MGKQRIHKIKSDFGMTDYFKFYKDRYGVVTDNKLYKEIITEFNRELINLIIEETVAFRLPYINFEISIRKDKRKPRIKDGKLVSNIPPNWKLTNELWESDPEAKEKKIIVRYNNYHTSGYVFRVYCKKFKSNLRYKSLYKFKANRKFTRTLSKRLLDQDKDNLNSFLLY